MRNQTILLTLALLGAVGAHAVTTRKQMRTVPDPSVQLMAGTALVAAGLAKFKGRTVRAKL